MYFWLKMSILNSFVCIWMLNFRNILLIERDFFPQVLHLHVSVWENVKPFWNIFSRQATDKGSNTDAVSFFPHRLNSIVLASQKTWKITHILLGNHSVSIFASARLSKLWPKFLGCDRFNWGRNEHFSLICREPMFVKFLLQKLI